MALLGSKFFGPGAKRWAQNQSLGLCHCLDGKGVSSSPPPPSCTRACLVLHAPVPDQRQPVATRADYAFQDPHRWGFQPGPTKADFAFVDRLCLWQMVDKVSHCLWFLALFLPPLPIPSPRLLTAFVRFCSPLATFCPHLPVFVYPCRLKEYASQEEKAATKNDQKAIKRYQSFGRNSTASSGQK
eukprot:EG_transcript_780